MPAAEAPLATVWGQPAAKIDATDCDLRVRRPRSDLVGPRAARAPLVRRGTRGHDSPRTSTQSRAAGRRIVLLSISTTRPRLPEGRQMVLRTCRGTLVSKLFARGTKVLRSEPLKAAGVGPSEGGPDPASAVAPEAKSRLELFLSWPHASFTHPGAHGKRTPRRKAIYALARLRMSARSALLGPSSR
jgi:hypothetical protein